MRLVDITPQNLEKLSKEELELFWKRLSLIWEVENINKEEVINRAIFIINEFKRRNLKIEPTTLLKAVEEWRKKIKEEFAKVYPSGEKLGSEITLEDILKFYEKPMKLMDNAINLVGGVVIHGKTNNDFETLVRIPPREELVRRIMFRLDRAIDDRLLRARQHLLDDFHGPFTDYIPLYDLVLVPCEKKEKQQMSEDIFEQEVRAKSPEAKRTAEKAKNSDKLTVMEYFYSIKSSVVTLMGHWIKNKYDSSAMIEYLKKLAAKQNQKFPSVHVQKKYDGIHCQIHRKGNKVIVYSDDGSDITHRLPGIIEEIKKLKLNNFILDCELEMWAPEHRTREEMAAYIHRKDEPNDSEFIVNVFDLLYVDEKDIHKESYDTRYGLLEKLEFEQSTLERPDLSKSQLNFTPTIIAKSETEAVQAFTKCAKAEASEGAMIKLPDFKYSLSGTSREIMKLKTYERASGIVWNVNTTKVPTVFNYDYAFAIPTGFVIEKNSIVKVNDKEYSNGGRSYDTAIKCKVGDIINIEFHSANLYKNPETGTHRIHLYEPVFAGKEEQAKSPETIVEVAKKAKDAGLLTVKTETKTAKETYEEIEEAVRQPFGSPGDKRYMADRLVRMMPEHKIYVEPFVGGGAVFWKKKPSEKEIINDKDPDIVMAYKTIQNLTDIQWAQLKKMDWRASKAGFARAKESIKKSTGLQRFHDFIYLKQFSDVAEMNSYDDRDDGKSWAGINNLMRLKARLEGVIIHNEDYATIIKKYDSKETFFYIDPPYPSANLSWKWMPQTESIEEEISRIKGKFLMSYEKTKAFSKFNKWTIKLWAIAHPSQHHQGMFKTEQLISNYKVKKNTKYLEAEDIVSGFDWFSIFHDHFVANGYAKNWTKLREENKIEKIHSALKELDLPKPEGERIDEILEAIRESKYPTFSKVMEMKFLEQEDPYLRYPDEGKEHKCVFQHHYRGRSVHTDNRIENIGNVLVGWTLNDQLPGEIKNPVESLAEAKKLDKQDIFKINWKTGGWKQRIKKGQKKPVNVSIVCEKKAPEPHEWLYVQGVVKPGEVGATKFLPGVFSIIASGTCEYGSQKPWSHEYFFSAGPINYKVVYRRLKLAFKEKFDDTIIRSVIANYLFDEDLDMKIQEAVENPYKVLEEIDLTKDCEVTEAEKIIPVGKLGLRPETGQVGWLAIKPIDQTPYVISLEAMNKKWVPPLGYSALPKKIRQRIPTEFQYWKAKSKAQAIEIRDNLYEAIKRKEVKIAESQHRRDQCMECSEPPTIEVKWAEGMAHAWFCDKHFEIWSKEHKDDIDYIKRVKDGEAAKKFSDNPNPNIKEAKEAKFVLQHHWWKGQVAIRFGPSTEHWDLRIDTGEPGLTHLVLEYNPLEEESISFYLKPCKDKGWMTRGKVIERIEPGQPGNPTKNTPAWIQILDSGNITVLEKTENFMKFDFGGKKLSGLWIAKRESPSSEWWILSRSKLPEPK